ncbi:MAG: ubiquinone biosynthesis protein UbiH [Polynucleobacter sp. 24-46-87]|jgi:ubiquinone biosynthesis UbiH/UbiF/VisC/COQ6 family hydroxylase|uniref:FAD-dependent monooxygenase n=1 Tax=unclassified Polynucleobacter TaxID=2640945 RepID=UPI000BCA985A|nr:MULTISPECIES: FAD-dependent monooxygenase [unclassified Polynucleobacter]OYY21152.1 MAG: ubiquinone biosynthesis protein UbiH [Polynucleobacter sp. 35-46-11]OZA16328.1 MAG: ubiquinone biosynthesis protein UbiH [Polynucleobacter sp. 24-46-87]OZA78455.1 MAG: ubiquinone biosynthesis protein UbiH [Polynucleobacter sp. 39-46-10]
MSEILQNSSAKLPKNTSQIRTVDVAVVGGGIAGKACALGLAQLGLQTIQIAPDLRQGVAPPQGNQWGQRIYAFSPSTQKLLAHLQIWDAIDHSRMQPVRDMRIFGDRGEKHDQLHLSAFEAGTPQLAWIGESSVIEHTLDQASRFQNKLERISDVVENIETDSDGVTLNLANGSTFCAQLVIAADGANSPIRKELGITAKEESYSQSGVVANWICGNAHLETACQWFLPGGDIVAMLPLPDQQVSMVWSTSPENAAELLKLDQAAWTEKFSSIANGAIVEQLGSLKLNSTPAHFPLRRIRASRFIGPDESPKVVLIGDAAHVMHPLAGQGLNLGLRDVATLLNILSKRESFRLPNDKVLLRRYERQRQGDTSALLWVTDKLKKLFSASSGTEKQLRNWGLGMVNRSHFIKRRLIERALGDADFE